MAFRPPQQPTSETVVVPAHGESVQISGVIRVPGPEERIVPLHDEGADRLAVRLGQPGLAGFDRRHHPLGREPIGPLLDATRLQPRGRVREYCEHDVDLAWSCSPNLHASIVARSVGSAAAETRGGDR